MTPDGDLDRERLGKLLGLFSSSHDGEVANAARAADALVRRAGMTWPDVVAPPQLPVLVTNIGDKANFASAREAVLFCLRYPDELTVWEINFCRNLSRQRKPASPKQRAVLQTIVAKVVL
jgi:hypothetical protein